MSASKTFVRLATGRITGDGDEEEARGMSTREAAAQTSARAGDNVISVNGHLIVLLVYVLMWHICR